MKIEVRQIPPEGLTLTEEIASESLDLDTGLIKGSGPISISADIYKGTNNITVRLSLKGTIQGCCSRCLKEFNCALNRRIDLNYPVDKATSVIDLNPDIREEIIIDYPINPLCSSDCKGLCPRCGANLNDSKCDCASK
ncbi:MAG: DUF177 domain-containing protein [Candidatus Omnitrophica bacterium]|nr:DUF177 domain-containing protein [Candidatus Omnitrophota bacterium]MBU1869431.1 DUF177 domain-containing protein [Candidatus Omnitrophota bacterium]